MSSPSELPLSDADAWGDAEPKGKRTSRRRFLRRALGGLVGVATGTVLYTWRIEPHWVELVRRPLPIAGLPSELVGKRLVQLSDLHVGTVVDQSYLIRSVAGLAALEPDMIVITGDLMSCNYAEQVPRVMEVIREMPRAPLGCFAIPGNHDYGHRWRQYQAVSKLGYELARRDVRLLRNEVADAGGLQIAGIDELWSRNFHPELAFAELDSERPAIALCHNPDAVDRPQWSSYRGWILAGHTHGGQCKPPFLPPPLLPVHNRRYVAGEYELEGGRRLYINRALGYLERVRFNCRPEITLFTLERAEESTAIA